MKKLLLLLFIVPFFGVREVTPVPKPVKKPVQLDLMNVNSLNRSVKKLEESTAKLNAVLR